VGDVLCGEPGGHTIRSFVKEVLRHLHRTTAFLRPHYHFIDAMSGVGSFVLPLANDLSNPKNAELTHRLHVHVNDFSRPAIEAVQTNLKENKLDEIIPKISYSVQDARVSINEQLEYARKYSREPWILLFGIPGETEAEFLPWLLEDAIFTGELTVSITTKNEPKVRKILRAAQERRQSRQISIEHNCPITRVKGNLYKLEIVTFKLRLATKISSD